MKMTVFYAKELPLPFGTVFPQLAAANLLETHVELVTVDADLDSIYRRMQGDVWSPNGEARGLIEAAGTDHTSMSVGDAVRTEDGRYFLCVMDGWREFA